ncbi:unnamed protein product [Closterium sp. NIES-54]
MLRMTLAELDFFPSSADPLLFVRCGSTPFFVLVYVDDLVFTTPDRRALAFVKEELQRRHTCTDLGELQCYLGVQITRDRAARTITLTQSHMVEQIITRFCFPLSKVQPTPLAVDHGLTAPPSDEPFKSSGPYPELVYCADHDKTYAPISSYVTLRIFLSIIAILVLNLMQLGMKNTFLQSKLDQSPLLWYKVLDDVLVSVDWKKSQVDSALYFKVGDDGATCWVLVYVDDLLAASSSTAMLWERKELLEGA